MCGGLYHLFGIYQGIVFFFGEFAALKGGFFQGEPFLMGNFCDLSRRFIADLGRKAGDQHQGAV